MAPRRAHSHSLSHGLPFGIGKDMFGDGHTHSHSHSHSHGLPFGIGKDMFGDEAALTRTRTTTAAPSPTLNGLPHARSGDLE